eukprot:Tbor_TRINITY_DN6143_c2_g1::TRINITY_DN6143_c2_g1_i10::g.21371::m.21371
MIMQSWQEDLILLQEVKSGTTPPHSFASLFHSRPGTKSGGGTGIILRANTPYVLKRVSIPEDLQSVLVDTVIVDLQERTTGRVLVRIWRRETRKPPWWTCGHGRRRRQ